MKFSRCQKALIDNAKESALISDPIIKNIDKLELIEAFKIENGIILKQFEYKLRKTKDSFLKGLFMVISKK